MLWRRWLRRCKVNIIRLVMNFVNWGSFRETTHQPSKEDMIQRVIRHGSEELKIFFESWLTLKFIRCNSVLIYCQRKPKTGGIICVRDWRLWVLRFTWVVFKAHFTEKYFLEDVRSKKEIELLEIKQVNSIVAEYAAKFESFVKFCSHYNSAVDEGSKCIKLESGFCPEIKQGIGYQEIH